MTGAGGRVDAGRDGRMLREVLDGLRRPQKELSPKYFYDSRGSELFEAITGLPEYYLTRTERQLLKRWVPGWLGELRPRALVELGSGSARKTRILLDALEPGALFVPVDVSEEFLRETADRLEEEYPELRVAPQVADLTGCLPIADDLPHPALYAFLGSTIGNFGAPAAVRLLSQVRSAMAAEDVFLLGADLRPGPAKSVERLEAAYDDPGGVTAAFNLNVLRVLNRELGADFDEDAFLHRAFYHPHEHRIEMHLVSVREQVVVIPGAGEVELREGETIRTEISCKYDRPAIEDLFRRAGLAVRRWQEDPQGLYALVLGGAA